MSKFIAYHGTDLESSSKILKRGFRSGTYFAYHLEDAIGFGGPYVFEVVFDRGSSKASKDKDWQFITSEFVSSKRIVRHYTISRDMVLEKPEIGREIFASNFPLEEQKEILESDLEDYREGSLNP